MNMKAYGSEMLKKQLGYAKAKGNEKYISELEAEISIRERVRNPVAEEDVVKDRVGLAGTQVPAMNIPKINNADTDSVIEQPTEPEVVVEPTAPLNADGSEVSNEGTEL